MSFLGGSPKTGLLYLLVHMRLAEGRVVASQVVAPAGIHKCWVRDQPGRDSDPDQTKVWPVSIIAESVGQLGQTTASVRTLKV